MAGPFALVVGGSAVASTRGWEQVIATGNAVTAAQSTPPPAARPMRAVAPPAIPEMDP